MSRSTGFLAFAAVLVCGLAGGMALGKSHGLRLPRGTTAVAPRDPPNIDPAARQLQDTFNAAAAHAMRSVVHITTQGFRGDDIFASVSDQVGSGVIVSAQGHILTNFHVASGARAHEVRLPDGREFVAVRAGDDPESDLALLKIDPQGVPLEPIAFSDTDQVRIGDWVLAIGSPLGYSHSVSAGIVSAKHRRFDGEQGYQDFLQTDAAINPGNSGGALVNLEGRLVGINSRKSRTGEGIGLAISSNLARFVADQLMKNGRVRRGLLGVGVADLNLALVRALAQDGIDSLEKLVNDLGLREPKGAWISQVVAGSPAARADLRYADVITAVGERPISSRQDLLQVLAGIEPGRTVPVRIVRNRKEKVIEVTVAERQRK